MKHLDALREANGISPSGIELLAAAKTRKETAVQKSLAAYEKAMTAHSDPVALFNIALQGGDPVNGASLFTSHPTGQCMRCHKAEEKAHSAGGDAGPNLAGIATRHDRRFFLESMLHPGADVAPGYGVVSVTFKSGATLGGNLLAETPEHLDLVTPEKAYRVKRSDIESFTPPVSAMPSMEHLLKPEEMRDLVAWLDTLKQEPKKSERPTPEPVDPSKLPGAKPQSSRGLFDQTPSPITTGGIILAQAAAPHEAAPLQKPALMQEAAPRQEPAPLQEAGPDNQVPPSAEAQMKLGQQQYILCAACHGQQGGGGPAAPPLASSEWVNGPVENLIRIQLRGLIGPIRVAGQDYNFPAGMPPMPYQSDEQIAAVLTYVRASFGNNASAVTPEQVAALLDEVGQPILQTSELIPLPPTGAGPDLGEGAPPRNTKYDDMEVSTGLPSGFIAVIAGFLLLCLVGAFRR